MDSALDTDTTFAINKQNKILKFAKKQPEKLIQTGNEKSTDFFFLRHDIRRQKFENATITGKRKGKRKHGRLEESYINRLTKRQ